MEKLNNDYTEVDVPLEPMMKQSLAEKNSQIRKLESEIHYLKDFLKRKTHHNSALYCSLVTH